MYNKNSASNKWKEMQPCIQQQISTADKTASNS